MMEHLLGKLHHSERIPYRSRWLIIRSFLLVLTLLIVASCSDDDSFSDADGETEKTTIDISTVLNGSNGKFSNPDRRVYAASVVGDEITVRDTRTKDIAGRIGPKQSVQMSDDLVIAPVTTILRTKLFGGNESMLKPNCKARTQFAGSGLNPITFVQRLQGHHASIVLFR